MDIKDLEKNWNQLGKEDPMWAILVSEDKKGNKWQPDEFFALGRKEIDELMEKLNQFGLDVNKGSTLDFGCGIGRLTQALAFYFNKVEGVDIAESMIELARKFNQFGEKCNYHLNKEAHLLIFSDNSFDFIYTNIVLQHMEPMYSKKYITEFIRLLKPEGVLVFQIPSEQVRVKDKGLKRGLKSIMPEILIKFFRRARYYGEPTMEMYPVPQEEIRKLVEDYRANLVQVESFESAGKSWKSFRYYVRKNNV